MTPQLPQHLLSILKSIFSCCLNLDCVTSNNYIDCAPEWQRWQAGHSVQAVVIYWTVCVTSLGIPHKVGHISRPLSRIFQKIRLAEPYFRLISGLAKFLRKLPNSAEHTPEHHKFSQQDRQIETIKLKI